MAKKRQPAPVQAVPQAGASKPSKNKPVPQQGSDDPLALLRYEHRTIESLFSQFVLRKDERVAQRVCESWKAHSRLEETLYETAESSPELHGRVAVARGEHQDIEERIRSIESMAAGEDLNEAMLELQQAVDQHVREEERSLFMAVTRDSSRSQLRELGTRLRTAKDKLAAGELTEEERAVASR